MDRTRLCGSRNVGSIPAEGTCVKLPGLVPGDFAHVVFMESNRRRRAADKGLGDLCLIYKSAEPGEEVLSEDESAGRSLSLVT